MFFVKKFCANFCFASSTNISWRSRDAFVGTRVNRSDQWSLESNGLSHSLFGAVPGRESMDVDENAFERAAEATDARDASRRELRIDRIQQNTVEQHLIVEDVRRRRHVVF